jgi:hypothetical protein
MHVDHSLGREVEHLGLEDVTICHYDAEIGLEAPQARGKHITYWPDGLEYGYSRTKSGNLHRRCNQL